MTKWYEYDTEDRIKNVYSKYSIKDFWNWWSKHKEVYMEIRITNYKKIVYLSKKYNIPYSKSGLYVKNSDELRNVIACCRENDIMWFGINPRKKNYNTKGIFMFGGMDTNISSINYIFVDIDRINKEGEATKEDLANCDKLIKLILDRLKKENWIEDYIIICSGNGVQLLIGLDIPIRLPSLTFNKIEQTWNGSTKNIILPLINEEYDKIKNIIKDGIGKDILTFSRRFSSKLKVSVDKTGFNIGRVGALPFTKNFKHDGFTWRGIVKLKIGKNNGLSDYVISKEKDINTYNKKSPFIKHKELNKDDYIIKDKLMEHRLVRLLLDNNFPNGGINNTLWFQLKILIRDSEYDINNDEFVKFYNIIKEKHNRTFTLNEPDKKFCFDKRVIYNYCMLNCIPSPYKFMADRDKIKRPQKYEKITECNVFSLMWYNDLNVINETDETYKLDSNTTIFEDLREFNNNLKDWKINNGVKIGKFLRGCIDKYGKDKVDFWIKHKLFFDFLSYK